MTVNPPRRGNSEKEEVGKRKKSVEGKGLRLLCGELKWRERGGEEGNGKRPSPLPGGECFF